MKRIILAILIVIGIPVFVYADGVVSPTIPKDHITQEKELSNSIILVGKKKVTDGPKPTHHVMYHYQVKINRNKSRNNTEEFIVIFGNDGRMNTIKIDD